MCSSCALISIERDWCLETQEVFGGYNIFKTDQMRFVRQKIQITGHAFYHFDFVYLFEKLIF